MNIIKKEKSINRIGYKSFRGAIKMLKILNKKAQINGTKMKFEITLPIKP